jgi:hypothetical protein
MEMSRLIAVELYSLSPTYGNPWPPYKQCNSPFQGRVWRPETIRSPLQELSFADNKLPVDDVFYLCFSMQISMISQHAGQFENGGRWWD